MQRLLRDSLFSKLLLDEINGFKLTTNTQQGSFTCIYSYDLGGKMVNVAICQCALDGLPLSLTIYDLENQDCVKRFITSYKIMPYSYVYALAMTNTSVNNLVKPFTYSGCSGRNSLPMCIKSAAYPKLSIANYVLCVSGDDNMVEIINKIKSQAFEFVFAKSDFNIEALKRQCPVFDYLRAIITINGYENHTGFHSVPGNTEYKIALVLNI